MSKIICFEKWDCDCGTLNQMSFEFNDSITINQISKLADRILNDYYTAEMMYENSYIKVGNIKW